MKKTKCIGILLALILLLASCNSDNANEQDNWHVGNGAAESANRRQDRLSPQAGDAAQTPTELIMGEASDDWVAWSDSDSFTPPARELYELLDVDTNEVTLQATTDPTLLHTTPRMVIRSTDMGLSTYYFSQTVAGIEEIIQNRGGFVETSNRWMASAHHDPQVMLWRADLTLRVPVGLFDRVNDELIALAQVLRFSTISQDVTREFHDITSRLHIRQEELRRVQMMLEAAEEIADILSLEMQVTTLTLAISAYQRRLTEIDQLASFSTIKVRVYETVVFEDAEEYEEEECLVAYADGFGTRLRGAFASSFEFVTVLLSNIALLLAYAGLPVLIILAAGYALYKTLKKLGLWKRPFKSWM